MNVLFCKTFGIGNAVMSVPAVKALVALGHTVDVLVGNTPDDTGALEVFTLLKNHFGNVRNIWVNSAMAHTERYDLAILSIPFDGRWQNGTHFFADRVMDGRTRPDPSTTGLVSWKKHEIEYQMDNVRDLGFLGETPNSEFMSCHAVDRKHSFYFGVGYKKDHAGFWQVKHWGNLNFAHLAHRILLDCPLNKIYMTGDTADMKLSIIPIMNLLDPKLRDRIIYVPVGLRLSFDVVSDCELYVGNDTGMMHVAAAAGRPVVAMFMLENSIVKSGPRGKSIVIDCHDGPVGVEEVFGYVKELTSKKVEKWTSKNV